MKIQNTLDWLFSKKSKHKKAFTLIELIVVMAVIAILVLLAAPKFLGYTQRAQETKDKYTAKVIETALEAYILRGGQFPDSLEVLDVAALNESATKGNLVGANGYVVSVEDGVYYELTQDFIEKLEVKLSDRTPQNELLIKALAASAPNAVYSSTKGVTLVDKGKTLKGYGENSIGGGEVENPTPEEEIGYSEETKALIAQGYQVVATPQDLDNVRNDPAGKYIQVADIDLSGFENFVPIANFTGVYNGGNHSIFNLTINRPTEVAMGLFSNPIGTTIENVNLHNVLVIGGITTGGLVGASRVGSIIRNSFVSGSVAGKSNVGVLAGSNLGLIEYSSSTGEANGNSEGVGGLVGTNSGIVAECFSTTLIKSGWKAGGLVGQNQGTIQSSYATGDVTSTIESVGGLVGQNNGFIRDSYATGDVQSTNRYVGGLVGTNSYNFNKEVKDRTTGVIERSFSTGFVKGTAYVGGLVGVNQGGTVKNSRTSGAYSSLGTYRGDVFGRTYDASVSGTYGSHTFYQVVTNVQKVLPSSMSSPSTFPTFDFVNVWEILPGNTHPTLIQNKQN